MLISKFSNKKVESKIKELEDLQKICMPEELKKFLLKYNGGETPDTRFVAGKNSSDVVGFYGVGDVKYSYDKVEVLEYQGQKYLPIAFDSFGNDILIEIVSGKVFFHNHETGGVEKLSEDLDGFIGMCESDRIKQASLKTLEEREQDLRQRGRGHIINDALRKMWQDEIDKYSSIKQEEVIL